MSSRLFIASISVLLLSNCSPSAIERLQRLGSAPTFSRSELPNPGVNHELVDVPQEMRSRCGVRTANSLWQPGNRSFFRDTRAREVGDIIKVNIAINDKAQLENQTTDQRSTSENLPMPNVFRLQKRIFSSSDTSGLLDINGNNKHSGSGQINRKENIKTEVSAIISQILPNGNMVIRGSQEIRVNFELRSMELIGIARPQDVSIDNTIDSTKLAELRVSYGGSGSLSDLQQPRIGSQLLDILSPF